MALKKIFLLLSVLFVVVACNRSTTYVQREGPQYITTEDSVKLMFVDKGDVDKTPVMFIQGSDGTSLEWQVFTKRLEKKYRLILFDRRGNGLSERLLPERKLNMNTYLADIAMLQKKLGIDKSVIVGWSFGGAVAAEYALKYPDKVLSLVLVNPLSNAKQLWIDRSEAVKPIALKNNDTLALRTIDKVEKDLPLTIDDEYEIVKLQNAIWYNQANADSFYKHLDAAVYGYNDSTAGTDWENIIAQKKIYDGYSNLDRISKITCPVLIIGGTHDKIISTDQCKKLHSLIPSSQLKIIQNCGHLPFIERPDELQKTLTDFIK